MEIVCSSHSKSEYSDILIAVKDIKKAIIDSRYQLAKLVNKQVLTLYYNIGEYISFRSRKGHWGTGAIKTISALLRQELPGLKGFSETSIKDMRIFFEQWQSVFANRQSVTADLESSLFPIGEYVINRQLTTADLTAEQLDMFFNVAFTHHREILRKTSTFNERLFYIQKCATEFWQVTKLKYALNENLFDKEKIQITNFPTVIPEEKLRIRALEAFKNNYLFDFVDLEDDNDVIDEKVLETQIVKNIKNFIMAFGQDFAFMGNQYRLTVGDEDLFVDLLFYHRGLRCLVAVELKSGKFKGAYAGQLNTYLSALDDLVRRQDENPSIGLILCKEKSDKMVEYAFRNTSTPMGVATYTLTSKLPRMYSDALPNPDDLAKLLQE
ncbi:MAG: PDDEXK nuclease domain-containing protein [Muribaculaceae bacterium]|nr:PDDEXK nuclease domain-containing protein [Muribaculaceae bacterium]